jgi:C4-dicarboxylate-specific signal transduction histidine kinase
MVEMAANMSGIAIEHQRAQQALRHSEERNRAILRAIPDFMFILSAEGVYLDYYVQDPTSLMIPPAQFLGKAITDVLTPAVAGTLRTAMERTLASGEPERFEYFLEYGEVRRFFEASVVRCDGDKFLSIVRDITDRKRAEMDAAIQRQELAHLSRVSMLGELSGALAHELSQPMAAILINAQAARRMLSMDPVDAHEARAALDDIISNNKRAGAVIERLRALLKKGDIAVEALDLNDIVRDVLDLAHSDVLARRVSVTTHLEPSTLPVHGDRVQLQQVLLNLVLNACESMSGTDADDRLLTIRTGVESGLASVSVTDRGVGIPDDQLKAVFEPFVTFRERGLGLGLAISRSIVVAHGGRIGAENNADRGATFRVLLPVLAT